MGTIKAPGRERFFNTTNPLPHHALRFKGHFKQSFSSELKTYFEQISSLSKIAMSLGEMNKILLQKIEELTLQVIDLQHQITQMKGE